MKLREAKIIKLKYQSMLNDLRGNRIKSSSVEITTGEDPMEYIHDKPENITEQIKKVHAQALKLNELFRNACNEEHDIPQLDGCYSIAVLLDRVKFVREEIAYFQNFASRLPKQRNRGFNNNDLVSIVTYDIADYKLKLKNLENEALLLSNIIDELDNSIEIDYEIPEDLI